MTAWKECNFLTRNTRLALGYRAFFPPRAELGPRGIKVVGESTPYYLFPPAAPRRAAALLSPLRATALLRDPVERAWSHYRHNVRLGIEPLSFEDALAAEPARIGGELDRVARGRLARSDALRHFSYAARGRYAEQLERWFAALGRDRVLVLLSDELFVGPEAAMVRIARFLSVENDFPGEFPARNLGDDVEIPASVRDRLRESFEGPNRTLAAQLGTELPW